MTPVARDYSRNSKWAKHVQRRTVRIADARLDSVVRELLTMYCADVTEAVDRAGEEMVEELVRIRKEQNISQSRLAELTGSKQQAISRTENREHSPSLKLFYCMANALGYDLQLVKL